MADLILLNQAQLEGMYSGATATVTSEEISTPMVSGITIVKTADKAIWTEGYLTYTITVANNAELAYTGLTLTDILDFAKVSLVTDSVKIDGTSTTYNYNAADGTLTVDIADLEVAGTAVITFQVEKV